MKLPIEHHHNDDDLRGPHPVIHLERAFTLFVHRRPPHMVWRNLMLWAYFGGTA